MAEQALKNPTGNDLVETQTPPEVNQAMLDKKIAELWELEKKLFNTDGKIWNGSEDSLIDKEYEKSIKEASSIKAKVELIDHLIKDFWKDGNIHGIIENEKSWKYIDEQDKENITKIETKLNELTSRYPEMKDQVKKFTLWEFHKTNYYADYYEKTGDKNHINAIKWIYKGTHQAILEVYIPRLEQSILDIKKNPFITDKASFVNYIVQDNNFSTNIDFTNSSADNFEKVASKGWIIRLSIPNFANNSIFSSRVFNNWIEESCCKTILGCGKNVSTKLS